MDFSISPDLDKLRCEIARPCGEMLMTGQMDLSSTSSAYWRRRFDQIYAVSTGQLLLDRVI